MLKIDNSVHKYRYNVGVFSHFLFFQFEKWSFYICFQNNFVMQSVEGMKVVCHELAQATSDPEGNAMDELVKDADRLVSCLANKAR